MIVKINDKVLLELSEAQMNVIKNDIAAEIFEADMERRVAYYPLHKYKQCFKRLKAEWEPRLSKRVETIPTDEAAFAELVFAQPDYKDRSARELEAKV